MTIKQRIRSMIPEFVLSFYHWFLVHLAALYYQSPSRSMIVIGVTGTAGKSSTCHVLSSLLESLGHTVGVASTIQFKVGSQERLNDKKMTMIGRFALQKMLRSMVKAGCDIAIVEVTSEGIKQHRHAGIHFDIVALTNLYPEHIESHGSFDNYKNEKLKLFKLLDALPHKVIHSEVIQQSVIVNGESEFAGEFLNVDVSNRFAFGGVFADQENITNLHMTNVALGSDGVKFGLDNQSYSVPLLGTHNAYNALLALGIGEALGHTRNEIKDAFLQVKQIPGRLEFINEGQSFKVIVDYAFEPRAMEKLYDTLTNVEHRRVLHVFGGTGGGRDTSHHVNNGHLVAQKADVAIITNEDPYDDDPMEIIRRIEGAVKETSSIEVHSILDRKEAIFKAIDLAREGDIILITGKGSEQAMCVAGDKKIPWDDRLVVKEGLKNMYGNHQTISA